MGISFWGHSDRQETTLSGVCASIKPDRLFPDAIDFEAPL